ncbi:MAG: DUF433 domain-containing protein [Lentimicrobiaceae bacterium]|nr:DUF433 domain-containing protein [Lentimicrobiaceae bacterium]
MENLASYISINPEIRFGKPCIQGTRIAVSDILEWMASGMSREEILNDYPVLQDDHLTAALSFAANRESFIKIIPTYANLAFA